MFVNNFITSTDLKAYLTWKLQIAITNPKAYFFLNYHLLNIRNNLHYIMINFYLNKTRLNGGQVAPHIVHRLKIKRAKREKRHRLQTTDMTSLACQILLLARNGSRYFYRSFFFFFFPLHANRTARIHHTANQWKAFVPIQCIFLPVQLYVQRPF